MLIGLSSTLNWIFNLKNETKIRYSIILVSPFFDNVHPLFQQNNLIAYMILRVVFVL